jgi:Uma2 family endonuclease
MTIATVQNQTSFLNLPKTNGKKEVFYPESDGKPMAETDKHVTTISYLLERLREHFSETDDVKILADIMFYYEEGNPYKAISPDVMIVKGVGKHFRRVFKLWEENVPNVIFEISSRKTWREDLQKKFFLYQQFGVKEYYIFDPEYDYLSDEPLVAFHLKNGEFETVKIKKGRVFSPALQLEVVDTGEDLRLYNRETKEFLKTNEELKKEVEKLKSELAKLKK